LVAVSTERLAKKAPADEVHADKQQQQGMPMIPVIFTQPGVLWVDPWSRIRLAYKSIGRRT